MAADDQIQILRQGVQAWNAWRDEHPQLRPDLRGASFAFERLQGANLEGASLERANLEGANLERANLQGANLQRASLRGAKLQRAKLQDANLEGAYLQLGGERLLDPPPPVPLEGADLQRARAASAHGLMGPHDSTTDLRGANLQGARFRGANLQRANFRGADLRGADFNDANLESARLQRAKLQRADFRGANLQRANLHDASLQDARLNSTLLVDVDLCCVRGIHTIRHEGPSTVDHRTLAHGRIPDAFLRGCGFQDWEIEAAKLHDPDLTPEQVTDVAYAIDRLKGEAPLQINPLFISYSRDDSPFVEALERSFDQKGVRYWRDVHNIKAGRIDLQIERAIRVNPLVLLVLSKTSVLSDWVEWEVEKARDLEKELRRDVLCPVALDDAWENCNWDGPLRKQVQKYAILDFSRWKDAEAYEKMFAHLIEGLGMNYLHPIPGR